MMKEFRDFINRGNVIDLAVGIIIGTAFTAIVNSLVNDIIMPLIGLFLGGLDFNLLSVTVGKAVIAYGKFLQAIVNFIIIAFVVFLIVKGFNSLRRKQDEKKADAGPSEEVKLLTDIRDELRFQSNHATKI